MQELSATDQKWFDLIIQARDSGLSDSAWCKQNGIPKSTFYYHVNKLRGLAAEIPAGLCNDTAEVHEVVKLDFLDEEDFPRVISHNPKTITSVPTVEANHLSVHPGQESVLAAHVQLGDVTVDFSNSACDQVIFSVINALRQSC